MKWAVTTQPLSGFSASEALNTLAGTGKWDERREAKLLQIIVTIPYIN